jgi:hypothetical protein
VSLHTPFIDDAAQGVRGGGGPSIVRDVVGDFIGQKHDAFAHSAGNRDVAAFQLEEEALFTADDIWVAHAERDQDSVAFAALESFDGVNRAVDQVRICLRKGIY